jgi:diaminopimelate epimerase
LAARLLAAEPTGEQVGFLSPGGDGADLSLRMAGGEFCGNAAMSAAAWWCAERGSAEGAVRVRVSGASAPVAVEAAARPEGGFACAVEMPRPMAVGETELSLDGQIYRLPLVRFDGICHLILPGGTDRAFAERAARAWCAQLSAPALGLMLLDEDAETMLPLVYVPGGDTLCWERSCASGTAAAGAYLAWKTGASAQAELAQPGGKLRVSVSPVGRICLRGTVKLAHVGVVSL